MPAVLIILAVEWVVFLIFTYYLDQVSQVSCFYCLSIAFNFHNILVVVLCLLMS